MSDPYLAALAAAQEHAASAERTVRDLRELIARQLRPAMPITVVLTQTEPIKRLEERRASASIGLLNPTDVPIFIGIAGGSASQAAQAPSAPARSLLVLPIAVEDLEVGANPADLAAGDAVVFVLRFETCQPAFLGAA